MARQATQGASQGRSGSSYTGFNESRESEQFVLIVANNSDLGAFTAMMHAELEASIEAVGGTLDVTPEQFGMYCVTAIKVRVEHVTRRDWRRLGYDYTGMTVTEGWAMPTPMHDVISSIGEIRLGTGETLVKPVWDSASDELVINKSERDNITRKLRSAFSTLGISFQDALSKDVEGHHQVMVLTYLPALGKWWTNTPITREDAAANLLAGMTPVTSVIRGSQGAQYDVVDLEGLAGSLAHIPMWVPDLQMERRVVVRYLPEMAKLRSA